MNEKETKIAEEFKASRPEVTFTLDHLIVTPYERWLTSVIVKSAELANENPDFDYDEFHKACGFDTDYYHIY